jgi:predicted amidohydrolase YtcJ
MLFLRFAGLATLAIVSACGPAAPVPDTVLVNGKIFTSNTSALWAQALAIRGDRIIAVGDTATITSLAGSSTRTIDLGGRTVVPGFNDAHVHTGPRFPMHEVKAPDEPTPQQVAEALASARDISPADLPIRVQAGGRVFGDPSVNRAWLDKVVPARPALVYSWTGHGVILNSAALSAFGYDESIKDPEGGAYRRDEAGRLNGRFEEYADVLMWRRLADRTPAEARPEAYRRFAAGAVQLGITSVQLMGNAGLHRAIVADVVAADAPLRWRILRWPVMEAGQDMQDSKTHLPPQPSPRVDARGMKWMIDGTPVEWLAALRQPYSDRPHERGRLNLTEERLAQFAAWAYGSEDPVAVHAVGDRAIEAYFAALEKAGRPEIWQRKRPRLEHGDMLMPDLIPRAKALGMVVVQNPSHLMIRDVFAERLGAERLQGIQPLKSLLDEGIPLALGSDGPLSPFLNIMFATIHPTRPSEALTREQAVMAYTYGGAFAEFEEENKGRLMVGALADLAVLSDDLFTVAAEKLPSLRSVLTLVGGQPVHNAGLWQ